MTFTRLMAKILLIILDASLQGVPNDSSQDLILQRRQFLVPWSGWANGSGVEPEKQAPGQGFWVPHASAFFMLQVGILSQREDAILPRWISYAYNQRLLPSSSKVLLLGLKILLSSIILAKSACAGCFTSIFPHSYKIIYRNGEDFCYM